MWTLPPHPSCHPGKLPTCCETAARCPLLDIGILDKFVAIVPIRLDMAGWVVGLVPLTEEMLLKIVPSIPR